MVDGKAKPFANVLYRNYDATLVRLATIHFVSTRIPKLPECSHVADEVLILDARPLAAICIISERSDCLRSLATSSGSSVLVVVTQCPY